MRGVKRHEVMKQREGRKKERSIPTQMSGAPESERNAPERCGRFSVSMATRRFLVRSSPSGLTSKIS